MDEEAVVEELIQFLVSIYDVERTNGKSYREARTIAEGTMDRRVAVLKAQAVDGAFGEPQESR